MNPAARAKPSVRMVLPYFGRWPEYLPLFLDGCRRNPDFNFLFLTDCPPVPAPPNVGFFKLTLAEVRQRAEARLGAEVNLPHAYKLCDLKPAYGLIFEDLLQGWDFWGFGDIDCIYGNLSRFATPEVLSQADIFCCRKEYVSGVFTLLRNNATMRTLFQKSPDWKRVFASEHTYIFDECAGIWNDLIFGKPIWECRREITTFTEVVFDALKEGRIRGYFETVAMEDVHAPTRVDSTGVYQNWMGWMLLHLVMCKQRWCFHYPRWDPVPDCYHVTRHGFYRADETGWPKQIIGFEWRRSARELMRRLRRKVRGRAGERR